MTKKNKKAKTLDDYIKEGKKKEIISTNSEQHDIIQSKEHPIMINDYEEAKGKMGIISKAKLTGIQRRTLLDAAKTEYGKRLELWKEKINAQGVLVSKKIDVALKLELTKIDEEHLAHIAELGIGNYDIRTRLQKKLADIAQQSFRNIENSDLADFLKKDLINRLIEERKVLADEISETCKF